MKRKLFKLFSLIGLVMFSISVISSVSADDTVIGGGAFENPATLIQKGKKANSSKTSNKTKSSKTSKKSSSKTPTKAEIDKAVVDSVTGNNPLTKDNPLNNGAKAITELAEKESSDKASSLTEMNYENAIPFLDKITSKVWFGNDVFGLESETLYLINSFVQAVFWLTKFIFRYSSLSYELLTSTDGFNVYLTQALTYSSQIFNSVKSYFLPLIGVSMAMMASYVHFVKQGSFFKTLLRMLIGFSIASSMFMSYNGKFVIQNIYDGTTDIANELANSVTNVPNSSDKPVLDQYFDTAVWKPYKDMNFEKNEDGTGYNFSEKEMISIVDYESGDDKFNVKSDNEEIEIKKFVGSGDEVKNKMMKAYWGLKFSYAVASLLDSIVLGILLVGFGLVAFVLKMGLILFILLGSFFFVFAMFPFMENILFNMIKRMLGFILLSSLIDFFSAMAIWFYTMLSTILVAVTKDNSILSAILKILVFWLMWKNKYALLSLFSFESVRIKGQELSRKLTNTRENVANSKLTQFGKRGAGKVAQFTGRPVRKARGFVKGKTNHLTNNLKDKVKSKFNLNPKTDESFNDSDRKLKSIFRPKSEKNDLNDNLSFRDSFNEKKIGNFDDRDNETNDNNLVKPVLKFRKKVP